MFTGAAITAALLLSPIAQDPEFHNFADQRAYFSIPNFWNVVSNFVFLVVGFYGLVQLRKEEDEKENETGTRHIYETLYAAIILTGIGSSYYHLDPDNERLVWDRLPMTVVFMSFLCAVIAERINDKAGKYLLIPLILAGIVSVGWWRWTELQGHGDLRPYLLVQFYPILAIPLIMMLFQSQNREGRKIIYVVALYVLAKLFEHLDQEIFSALGFISGHSLKHFAAGAAVYFIVRMRI